mmetsp:Transcript_19419/g.54556  ORF Transcript_19419/g.54556 Transcript_19419/m.54556 type:complete len:262 (+) Transcript_19419:2799-3584(+)
MVCTVVTFSPIRHWQRRPRMFSATSSRPCPTWATNPGTWMPRRTTGVYRRRRWTSETTTFFGSSTRSVRSERQTGRRWSSWAIPWAAGTSNTFCGGWTTSIQDLRMRTYTRLWPWGLPSWVPPRVYALSSQVTAWGLKPSSQRRRASKCPAAPGAFLGSSPYSNNSCRIVSLGTAFATPPASSRGSQPRRLPRFSNSTKKRTSRMMSTGRTVFCANTRNAPWDSTTISTNPIPTFSKRMKPGGMRRCSFLRRSRISGPSSE